MGTIHLALSGNAFHSDVPQKRWHEIDSERLGLEIIGESGLPVSVSFQGIDFELFPWLKETLLRYPSIECVHASYGHGLIPFMHPVQQEWEIKRGPGTHRVTFFPEFYTPEEHFIPDMFFVLGPRTVAYTLYEGPGVKRSPVSVTGNDPENFPAIRYGDKTGLVMKDFNVLLGRFFAFQQDPYSLNQSPSSLSQLLEEVERIMKNIPATVIIPLDIEAPYIGSLEGAKVWEIFVSALKQSGLDTCFVSLESVIHDVAGAKAITMDRPHRELTSKWFGYEAQFAYYSFIREFEPKNERDHFVLSLAGTSDVLSSLYRKVTALKRSKELLLSAIDFTGRRRELRIGTENEHVFELCRSAWLALNKGLRLTTAIKRHCDRRSLLVKRTLLWAEKYNL